MTDYDDAQESSLASGYQVREALEQALGVSDRAGGAVCSDFRSPEDRSQLVVRGSCRKALFGQLPFTYAGGIFTLVAARKNIQAISIVMGNPSSIILGCFPVATSTMLITTTAT
jgi:hypothetical protein